MKMDYTFISSGWVSFKAAEISKISTYSLFIIEEQMIFSLRFTPSNLCCKHTFDSIHHTDDVNLSQDRLADNFNYI